MTIKRMKIEQFLSNLDWIKISYFRNKFDWVKNIALNYMDLKITHPFYLVKKYERLVNTI